MNDPSFVEIGNLGKSWGSDGTILAAVYDDYISDVVAKSFVFLCHDGLYVPYYITSVAAKGKKLMIRFEDICNLEDADKLKSMRLYFKTENAPFINNQHPLEELVGFIMYNHDLAIGRIERIDSYPQQELAVIIKKEKEIMIPLHEQLIDSIDMENKILYMQLPDGLI